MKIIDKKVFEGKNIYSHKKCIRMDVDLCGYCEIPSKDIEGFNLGLLKLIPELKQHRCGIDEDGGFVKRLNEGTYLAHICEHIIIAIQNKLGIDVSYGKSREIKDDIYYIIFEYEYKSTALESARLAIDIINSLINKEDINYKNRIKILKEILNGEYLGPSTLAIKNAAERCGLPVFELGESGFFQVGYGKQGRIIEATIGAKTSCVAADIACDKALSKELLKLQNVPVARGGKVYNIINLLKEGERIGYPLVLKPRFGSKGEGVALNIHNEKDLLKAYDKLSKKYSDLIIEEYIEGSDYRVCVVDYNVIAVAKRIPPFVLGDGIHNIKYLIRELNKDPMRGYDHEKPLTKIKINEELLTCLEKSDKNLNYIPELNESIVLRENANLSTGGIGIDYTDKICEENKDICIRTAKAIGLDVCGIDIKAFDISKPLYNQGAIMEVNAAPGIRMHEYPYKGKCIDVASAILNMQYNGVPSNIPVISITGTNGKTTTTRIISHILSSMGYCVGMTSTEGIFIDGHCIEIGDDAGYYSAKTVLLNKDIDVAVLETARGGIIKRGLAYDNADIAVITNITEDHIGVDGVETMEDLAFVKSLVGEAVKEEGYTVLNADDKYSKTIINRISCKKIFFSKSKENPLISNLDEDSIALYVDKNSIFAKNNKKDYKIVDIRSIPIAMNGILEFNIENILAACSALVALGVDYCMIARGLRTFKLNANLGRFNLYDINGVKVVLDYGHNIEGYKSVLKSLQKIKSERVIGIVGAPGDRINSTLKKIGSICGEYLDEIIIKEDKDRRGRKKGEVAEMLKCGIKEFNPKAKIKICLDEKEAFKKAIAISKTSDIVVIFYEDLKGVEELIKGYENFKSHENLNSKLNLANL